MKTDKFDEAFRRKVESFHPPFRDTEIDSIQAYVKHHTPLGFWQRFGHTFTYSVGAGVILSLLVITLKQSNENKNLLNEIANLSQKVTQIPSEAAPKLVPKNAIVEKTDTVYIVKYIEQEKNIVANEKNSTKGIIPLDALETTNEVEKPLLNIFGNAEQKVPEQQTNITDLSLNKINRKDADKTILEPIMSNKPPIASNDFAKNQVTDSPQKSEQITEIVLGEKSAKHLIISALESKKNVFLDEKIANNLRNRRLIAPKFEQNESSKRPTITLPELKYRIGLGGNMSYRQAGTSVLIEALITKRWSVTSGLNIALLGYERFGDEDDFRRKKDKDFRNEYPNNVPSTNIIENIASHQALLRVPFYLNYRLPMPRNFTFLLSTGTDLDVSLREFTSYSNRNFSRDNKKEDLIERKPVVLFNNLLFSAGIEKRWNRFSVQLNPYLNTQFEEVPYQNEKFAFGLKLNTLYRLSR